MVRKIRLFGHKLTHWEYWPMEVVYFPVFFYWLYLGWRSRSLFFFSASNPSIETGGMLGEVKYDILQKIPEQYRVPTLKLSAPFLPAEALEQIGATGWQYPLVFKPDVGERGNKVEKIADVQEAIAYLEDCSFDLLVQPFVTLPLELGIFYYRYPSEEKGRVISIVIKDFLKVKGDGVKSLRQLVEDNPRAAFQAKRLEQKMREDWDRVLPAGEERLLEPIGNHCRGTSFLNGNSLIDDRLNEVFDDLSKQIEGFYFGRFDLKCSSVEALKRGQDICIMELNGAGSEQGHIYHPGFSFFTALSTILRQWRILFEVSRQNHLRGVPYMTWKEGLAYLRKSKQLRRQYGA